ncbi:unnamed protein product [Psylliodes chrysocephalus]|uniref:Uncharacterized protein n=1 Tax=Psylliodes chrysocephalus TaxID=3402493 RepID=A0A9P0D1H7_9CUCU|nr:unnamed protein product [Psylliodes chrysocephala]
MFCGSKEPRKFKLNYENRCRFKSYINTLALTKSEGDEKVIQLKAKFSSYDPPAATYREVYSPTLDPINSIGIPVTPTDLNLVSPRGTAKNTPPKSQLAGNRPPPYRPPPPVYSSTTSLDSLSLGSMVSLNELALTPQAPPRDRRKDSEKSRSISEESTPKKSDGDANFDDKTVSVKERTQKFNRLASVEDELSPRQPKSAEKENRRPNWGPDQDDGLNLTPLEPKKCMEWYVTASRGDYQELLKLANNEPRLVSKKVSNEFFYFNFFCNRFSEHVISTTVFSWNIPFR